MRYDCIIIGSGLAGLTLAYGLKHQGKKVAVIEKENFGGVVNNTGSTRKKELITLADHILQNQRFVEQGIVSSIEPNFEQAMHWINSLENTEDSQHESALNQAGITTIYGEASFLSKNEVSVDGIVYSSDIFVIATGGQDRPFTFKGSEYLSDSAEFLTQKEMPKEILFLGAGIISFAFITIANAFKSNVRVLQHNSFALRAFDQELSSRLIEINKKRGVNFLFNESIVEINLTKANRFLIRTSTNQVLEVDKVFNVAGRIAQVGSLKLENAQVDYNQQGIYVNEYLQTNQENIFACGDCSNTSIPKLATYAALQGEYLVNFLSKKNRSPIHHPIPAMSTFSSPRLSQVGVTVEYAQEHPEKYRVETVDMSEWLDIKRKIETGSLLKIVIQTSDNHLVGSTALSQDADLLINYIAMGLNASWSKAELKKQIYAYPSLANELERFWKN